MNFQLREFTPAASESQAPNAAATASANGPLPYIPNQPKSIEETGLSIGFLTDLILKIIYFTGNITGQRLEEERQNRARTG